MCKKIPAQNLTESFFFLLQHSSSSYTIILILKLFCRVEWTEYLMGRNLRTFQKYPSRNLCTFQKYPSRSLDRMIWLFFGTKFATRLTRVKVIYEANPVLCRFVVLCSYYMLILWFPELMNRFRRFETSPSSPDGRNETTMCEIVSKFRITPEAEDFECNDRIDQSVYVNIIIVGIACIPLSVIVPLFNKKLGLRFFTGSAISMLSTYIFPPNNNRLCT